MHRQTSKFEKLWQWTERAREAYQSKPGQIELKLDAPLLDINPEGQLEKEIMDIIEELGIMIYINKEHRDVLNQFITNVTHILDPDDQLRAYPGVRTAPSTPLVTPARERSEAFPLRTGNLVPSSMGPGIDDTERRDKFRSFNRNSRELMTRVNDRIEQLEELKRSAESTAESVSRHTIQPDQY